MKKEDLIQLFFIVFFFSMFFWAIDERNKQIECIMKYGDINCANSGKDE